MNFLDGFELLPFVIFIQLFQEGSMDLQGGLFVL